MDLYADFMAATDHPGPVNDRGWKEGALINGLSLRYSYKQRVRWFIRLLKECLKHLGLQLPYAYGLPSSQMVQMHTGIIALPWPLHCLQIIDAWMFRCVPHAFKRQSKVVDTLPYLDRLEAIDGVVLSSVGM